MDIRIRDRYPKERATLLVTLVVGVVLLWYSVQLKDPDFWHKFAEVVGTALVLVVVIDVFYNELLYFVRWWDRKIQLEMKGLLAEQHDRRLAETMKQEAEALARAPEPMRALGAKIDRIDLALAAFSKR